MDNTLKLLEYYKVLEALAKETHSKNGMEEALKLKPNLTTQEILNSWALVEECCELVKNFNPPSLRQHYDITEILGFLESDEYLLNTEQLSVINFELSTTSLLVNYFQKLEKKFFNLRELIEKLKVFPHIIQQIERTVGPDGEILDTASVKLASLRKNQNSTKNRIMEKLKSLMQSDTYKDILQDNIITDRANRFVIPVKASSQNKGLVHDWSKTGATAFLEPLETVEDNNNLSYLKGQEKQEIERILKNLTLQIKEAKPDLLVNGLTLTKIDLYLGKGRLARNNKAVSVKYTPGEGINLIEARHPLLEENLLKENKKITTLDIILKPQKNIMVISGVNTGGKTVAMKTAGLLVLMAKTGLFLPVKKGSSLDFPKKVFTVIGDEQDLSSNLSTFSGHIKSINYMLNNIDDESLIILDELGSGTDPNEGAALGLAVLEHLNKTKALVMSATHYQLIKNWALLNENVISVAVNSANSGKPLYGLTYGSPGFSGGLKMALHLGLPEDLVFQAESYLDEGQKKAVELLNKLDEEKTKLWQERKNLENERLLLAEKKYAYEIKTNNLIEKHNIDALKTDKEIREAIEKLQKEFDKFKKEVTIKNHSLDNVSFNLQRAKVENTLKKLRPSLISKDEPLKEINEGDYVLIKRLNKKGFVKTVLTERKEAWVDLDGLNIKTSFNDLYAAEKKQRPQENKKGQIFVSGQTVNKLNIKVIGKTVEEAIFIIEKEIDVYYLNNIKEFSIIHGYGTGRLRLGIREYLKSHSRVKSYAAAVGQGSGGEGVTEVILRD